MWAAHLPLSSHVEGGLVGLGLPASVQPACLLSASQVWGFIPLTVSPPLLCWWYLNSMLSPWLKFLSHYLLPHSPPALSLSLLSRYLSELELNPSQTHINTLLSLHLGRSIWHTQSLPTAVSVCNCNTYWHVCTCTHKELQIALGYLYTQ
jgi:hypothetical protein